MADRREVGADRPDLVLLDLRQRRRLGERRESLSVIDLLTLGSLQEREVAQCLLVERQQRNLYPCRKRAWWHREVGAREVGRGADRDEQVLDEGEVQHLLLGDLVQRPRPALGQCRLLLGDALARVTLERERREQVLADDQLLELGRLGERVDQRLAVFDAQLWLGVDAGRSVSRDERLGQRSALQRHVLGHLPKITRAPQGRRGAEATFGVVVLVLGAIRRSD